MINAGWIVRTAAALAAAILLTVFLLAMGWDPEKWKEKGEETDEDSKHPPV